jgi:hypothetical protein
MFSDDESASSSIWPSQDTSVLIRTYSRQRGIPYTDSSVQPADVSNHIYSRPQRQGEATAQESIVSSPSLSLDSSISSQSPSSLLDSLRLRYQRPMHSDPRVDITSQTSVPIPRRSPSKHEASSRNPLTHNLSTSSNVLSPHVSPDTRIDGSNAGENTSMTTGALLHYLQMKYIGTQPIDHDADGAHNYSTLTDVTISDPSIDTSTHIPSQTATHTSTSHPHHPHPPHHLSNTSINRSQPRLPLSSHSSLSQRRDANYSEDMRINMRVHGYLASSASSSSVSPRSTASTVSATIGGAQNTSTSRYVDEAPSYLPLESNSNIADNDDGSVTGHPSSMSHPYIPTHSSLASATPRIDTVGV